MAAGGDIDEEVFAGIESADTFLVFGTSDYGENTGNQACTYYEYKHAFSMKKRIILIRMISWDDDFAEQQARVIFGANRLALFWQRGTQMPPGLVDAIVDAVHPTARMSTLADSLPP